MRRHKFVTLGFLLIFFGIQFNVVETYTLSPKATKFWEENIQDPDLRQPLRPVYNAYENSPFQQASYTGTNGNPVQPIRFPASYYRGKQISPPDWLCWPFIFVGSVMVLYGTVLDRG